MRIPLAYVLTHDIVDLGILGTWLGLGMGLFGAWVAMAVDLYIRGTFFLLRFASGRGSGPGCNQGAYAPARHLGRVHTAPVITPPCTSTARTDTRWRISFCKSPANSTGAYRHDVPRT